MNALLLLMLDSRAPAGAHNHSGGMEAAVGTGLVAGPGDVEQFCRARLRTSGPVAAAFAASACRLAQANAVPEEWELLDAELDARIPSEAARGASRQLGGGLLRLLRSLLPSAGLVTPWGQLGSQHNPPALHRSPASQHSSQQRLPAPDVDSAPRHSSAPHHPLVLGAGVAVAGGNLELAARAAALAACAGPASAAVRLLGLDPFAVQGMLARLSPDIDSCAEEAALAAADPPAMLPCEGAPALDLLADYHLTREVRLFAS
jgi:urease accessory protein